MIALALSLYRLDSEVIAPSLCITNVHVLHFAGAQKSCNERFDFAVVDVFFRYQTSSVPVGNHCQAVAAKLFRETCGIVKSYAGILVNEDGPRQWQVLDSVKGVVGEKNPPLLSNLEVAQTVAAWTISGRHFGMSGMAIARRAHRGADEIGDLGWNGGDAE
jgi:hypothetical protein